MLLSEKLGEAVLLLSLVALCTAGESRILKSLVNNADDTLHDPSLKRDDLDDLLLTNFGKFSSKGSPKSSDRHTTHIHTHYYIPYHTRRPYAYGSFASPSSPYTPNPYNYGLYAMTTPYPYHPMAGYHPYSAMNSLYGYHPMAAPYFNPAMNSLYVPLNTSFPKPALTAYTFHAPLAPFSYLRPPMGYSPLYPPMGGSYYPMNPFYPYSAALMPFNSFHPPMYPLSYLHPPMGYPFVYPYNLMNPMYNHAHPMHPWNPYSPMNPVTNLAHPMNPYSPMNPVTNLAHPMNPINPYSPMNPVTNPAHPMNPYNPMNPINSLYHGLNFAHPFHPPMQVASYFLTHSLGTSYLFPSNGYGHFHPVATQAASRLLQPSLLAASPLNLHMHFPYSYRAGMFSPYFLPPYHPLAALQALYPPYGYAAGFLGAMPWNQFGGAAWNPYSAMGYGTYPMWPSQFTHLWPLHPYYQTAVPTQEGMCSYDRPFKCWGSYTCVPIDAVCDKTFDCSNHADEDPRICIAGRRPDYVTLVSYLALPDQQWMLQKLFNNVDPPTTAYALKLATSLRHLSWLLALSDENVNNTKTVMQAVKNDDKGPLVALGMQASAWESVKFLMNSLLSTDFFLD